jgi:putative ABC transport system ATP-binding protein
MEPVRLIERRLGGDAVEEEGVEQDTVFSGEAREDGVEFLPIIGTEIAGCQHADEEHRELALLKRAEDAVERLLGGFRIDAAKRVIGAKLHDDPVDFRHQRPVEPLGTGGRGVARHPSIGDHDVVTPGLEGGFEPGRKGLSGLEAETSGQAVAEGQNMDGLRLERRSGEKKAQKKREIPESHVSKVGIPYDNGKSWDDMDNSKLPSHLGQMPAPLISLQDVHLTLKSRAGPVDILRGIDLTVAAGEALGIVGPSGSGKTTLLMVIAGLERVSSGTISVNGTTLAGKNEDALARFRRDAIGIVFQSFHLIPTMTALENVAVPLEFKGIADAMDRAEKHLGRVGLAHRLTHYPGQLSGGEQQRVAIARALASGAKIILADEPTGNLDIATGAAIMDLLFTLKQEEGATLLLITHDQALARRCDRIASVRDGRIVSGAHP